MVATIKKTIANPKSTKLNVNSWLSRKRLPRIILKMNPNITKKAMKALKKTTEDELTEMMIQNSQPKLIDDRHKEIIYTIGSKLYNMLGLTYGGKR